MKEIEHIIRLTGRKAKPNDNVIVLGKLQIPLQFFVLDTSSHQVLSFLLVTVYFAFWNDSNEVEWMNKHHFSWSAWLKLKNSDW